MNQTMALNIFKISILCLLMPVFTACISAQMPSPSRVDNSPVEVVKHLVDAETDNINVSGEQMPKMPDFPSLVKKKGKVRGYVKDTFGNPLAGAAIGVKSIRFGSSTIGSDAESDAKGYYEINIPLGAGMFHFAGYTINYGDGRAALGLHPADGAIGDFTADEGEIENFVLMPYGIADCQLTRENPKYSGNFYGGAVTLLFDTALPGLSDEANAGKFNTGSEIEIILFPTSALIDGSRGKAFVIRKKIDDSTRNEFFINNIPIGKYRVTVKTSGKPVKMRQRLPEDSVFGIHPKEANGEGELLFYPMSDDPKSGVAASGSWHQVEIYLEKP